MFKTTLKGLLTSCFVFLLLPSIAQKNALENSAVFVQNGLEYHDDEKYQSAVKQYDKVHRNDTNYPLALYEKSLSLLAGEKYKECIEACKEGLSLPATTNEAFFYITYGSALSDLEEYDESIRVFKEGIKLYPYNSTIRFNLALVQLRAKMYNEGLNTLYKNLEDNPFHGRSHLLLGEIAKQKGYPTKALLSYSMYIMMEDRSAVGYGILQSIDNYSNSKMDEGGDYEETELDNKGFGDLDELIFNKVAINDKYKTPSKFKFPYIKQLYLVSSSLSDIAGDEDDFWVRFYIPFIQQIIEDEEFSGFSSYLVRSGQTYSSSIAKGLEKSSKQRASFISWFKKNFTEIYAMKTVDGKKIEYHYNGGKLVAKGSLSSNQQERLGDWVFYNSVGSKSAKGNYQNNKKNGKWEYYHTGNRLESWYEMTEGKVNGNFEEYNIDSILIKKGMYAEGLYDGIMETYYETGGILGRREFNKGVLDGVLEYYYKNGVKSVETKCTDGDINGLLTRYNALGKKSSEVEYTDDKKNGYSKVWYSDGELESHYTYLDDELNGSCKKYYRNGQLKQEQNYTEGMLTGSSKSYFDDGTKRESSDFDENGKENGVFQEFYPSGKLYANLNYKNGDMSSYSFLAEDGSILSEGKKRGKTLEYLRIDSNGYKNLEGSFVKGVRDGDWKVTGPRGVLYSELVYDEGLLSGAQKRYYSNGQMSKEYTCKKGNIEGMYKMYAYGNPGTVTYEGIFNMDTKEGRFIERNKMGILVDDEYYVNGETDGWQVYHSQKGVRTRESYTKDGYFMGIITYDSAGKNGKEYWLENGNGELKMTYEDGKTRFTGNYANGSSHGTFTWYYPNGEIDTKGEYVNDERHGKWVSYHPNGKLYVEKNYNFGNLQGEYKSYFADGTLKITSYYEGGYENGIYTRYFYNGKIRETSEYKTGDLHGLRKSYVPTGDLAIVRRYVDDVLMSYSYMDKSGKLTEPVKLGETKESVTAYFKNGKPSVKFTLEKDQLMEDFIWHYPSGEVFRKSSYTNGAVSGVMTAYYPNGNKMYEYPHKYGEFHGICIDYHENGKMKEKLSYFCGELEGESTFYDANGKLTKTVFYFDNAIYFEKP